MNKTLILCCLINYLLVFATSAQVGIGTNTPDASAQLDIRANDRGILIPRMTADQRDKIESPAKGLMIYNTDDNTFWYFDGNRWLSVLNSANIREEISLVGGTSLTPTPQLISLLNGQYRFDSTGIIYDSGGEQYNYSNNENFSFLLDGYLEPRLAGFRIFVEHNILFNDSLIFSHPTTNQIIAIYTGSFTTQYDTLYLNVEGIRVTFKSDSGNNAAGFKITYNKIYNAGAQGLEPYVTGPWYYRPETQAIAGGSNAIPNNLRAMGRNSFSYGLGTDASGHYSTAFGIRNTASGRNSIAAGIDNSVAGTSSAAFGEELNVPGIYSFATGQRNIAAGYYTFSVGFKNTAQADYSSAFGARNIAGNILSTTFGTGNIAKAYLSMTMGANLVTKHSHSLVIGRYNDTTAVENSPNIWNPTDPIFVVGNGLSNNRTNALTLLKNGNLTIAGNLTQNSDARLKRNIQPITGVMDKIRQLTGYHYNWATHYSDNEELNTGLLAHEIEKVMPELVREDGNGIKSVNYNGMIPYLLEAIKTLQTEVEMLKKR